MHIIHAFVTVALCYTCKLVIANCDATFLSKLNITTIGDIKATYILKGTKFFPDVSGCGNQVDVTANLCRLTMQVPTSNRSSIRMDVWLPDNWDGRYVSTGNGGLAGCIAYGDLAYLSGLGLAAGGANGGHDGGNVQAFSGNIEVIKDYSYRSVHKMTVTAKSIVKSYYGTAHNKAYYFGCSTGGRQGLQSAQMFPEDFDGISAGACAADFNHLTGWSGYFYVITGTKSASTFVTPAQWQAIHNQILTQCDGLDGVNDGIIEDPDLCNFDMNSLLCSTSNSATCFTPDQATTVQKVLSALRGTQGELLYPSMQPGAELDDISSFYGGSPNSIPTQWYQYAIFNNPNWDPATLTITDIENVSQLDLAGISTWNGDLSKFRDRGGKLQTYHGLRDPVISSTNSERYYKHVSSTMNLPPVELDKFYRYFRISGMGHCGGGEGAWNVFLGDSVTFNSPSQSVLFSLINWVENGQAPDTIQGTKFVNDDSSKGISFQRNHCRYPFRTTYVAGGDPNLPSSWTCKLIVDNTAVMSEET